MKLSILGSNSNGNCYIIHNDSEALILECGIRFSEVQKALNFNLSKVVGVLVSHEHGDHFKHVGDFINKRIPVYASAGTFEAKNIKGQNVISSNVSTKIGKFTITPFALKHDCNEPLGFYINHPETGNILFATDTYYLPFLFPNVRHWMIECNYRKDILDRSSIDARRRNRLLESHMSFATCLEALQANDLSKTNNIILIHLSDGNSNAREFRYDIEKAFGKTTYTADKGMEISLTETPF
ncbi:MBL fold metallo-hydrolase [Epilithonimonas xixisoli]|uniref:Phosphoribosyl 1,2-cyclic phosphodiesterase n=1 Tax=Epilithonimonas xixisoli TaxID=1476462 RepID=A0A4R8I5V4_9FLAO|nr:MBL fold metallo-hydrolase [Epilithonimonas xixisoli]TDX83949.1 phosphoribosyl 1,2-cyclic phosphodiesterase [Epilithonimonas xixisoli]